MSFDVFNFYSVFREAVDDASDHKNNVVVGKKTAAEAAVKELDEVVGPTYKALIVTVKV